MRLCDPVHMRGCGVHADIAGSLLRDVAQFQRWQGSADSGGMGSCRYG
jgi:hypothetical protein